MPSFDPVSHLAHSIARYGAKPSARIAMLWAYFDETIANEVDHQRGGRMPARMFIGGCVSTYKKWELFSARWRAALEEEGVDVFHAKDFYAFRREFSWFLPNNERDWDRHGRFRDKLADIIIENADELLAFTSMSPIKEKGIRKAYEDAVCRAIYDATKFREAGSSSLYIVLARHPELSQWSILRRFEKIDWENKLAGCGIFSPMDVIPLQASDFVLHSLNKRWGGAETKSFQRLVSGCRARNIPFHQQVYSGAKLDTILGES